MLPLVAGMEVPLRKAKSTPEAYHNAHLEERPVRCRANWGHHPLDGVGPQVLGWEPRDLDLEGEPPADLGPGVEGQRKQLPLEGPSGVPGQGYTPPLTLPEQAWSGT